MGSLTEIKRKTVDVAEKRIRELEEAGELHLPNDYSASNALRSAWLTLQETKDKNSKPVLEACNRTSIINALLETVILGLSPAREQVYYVAYGRHLVAQPSYFGRMALAKRVDNVLDIRAEVIYEGEEVTIEVVNGNKVVSSHKSKFGNIDDNKVTGAYAVVEFADSRKDRYTIMNMEDIKSAWSMGRGETDTHKKFTARMARKTVISRACNEIINSANDNYLMDRAMSSRADYETEQEVKEEAENGIATEPETIEVEAETVEANEPEPETEDDFVDRIDQEIDDDEKPF